MAAEKILVVDDDAIQLKRLTGLLGSQYTIETTAQATGLIDRVRALTPDLVILDIELPDGNGIDLCRDIKSHDDLAGIPVVFHSSHDTLENRMEAYEAGGGDFFLKSMTADELRAKVGVLLDWVSRNKELERARIAANRSAQANSASLGELSIALEALREAGKVHDLASLAQLGADALGDWGVDANVQVRAGKDAVTLGRKGHATPLEVSILHNLRLVGPKFQLGSRMVLNFSHASVLLRNLPVDNAVQAQRVADKASIIGEGLSARAAALENELVLEASQAALESAKDAVAQLSRGLDKVDATWHARAAMLRDLLGGMKEDLERQFLALALSKKEEAACLTAVQQRTEQIAGLFAGSPTDDPMLQRLRERLARQGG